jgi:hypothetical protein
MIEHAQPQVTQAAQEENFAVSLTDRRRLIRGATLLSLALPLGGALPVLAQQRPAQAIPSEAALELFVKQSLLSFNDANLTGNYSVFHATLSEQFRRQFTVEQVRQAFRAFHEQQIDMAGILLHKYVLSRPAAFNAEGALEVSGRFDTRPLSVFFTLTYLPAGDDDWRLLGLNVNVAAPEQQAGRAASPAPPAAPPAAPTPGGPQRGAKGKM